MLAMKVNAFLIASLAVLGASADGQSPNPAICVQAKGVYDVCDTDWSFVRCHGHEAMLIKDCRVTESTYCRVTHGKGRCDSLTPPDLHHHHHNQTHHSTPSSVDPACATSSPRGKFYHCLCIE
ncbi:hypothetical protein F4777DRAFT_564951 [Nemania sp. FL0916]|nr:hypothetical protein F4777DRAFT_564951 [Nemania sp. FL0916]